MSTRIQPHNARRRELEEVRSSWHIMAGSTLRAVRVKQAPSPRGALAAIGAAD
jgi:hypothetical protein